MIFGSMVCQKCSDKQKCMALGRFHEEQLLCDRYIHMRAYTE